MIRQATIDDIPAIDEIAKLYKYELGWVRHVALKESIAKGALLVVVVADQVIGFAEYNHAKRGYTSLYHIAVSQKGNGYGRQLIDAIIKEAKSKGSQFVRIKCPVDLSANKFYERLGFSLAKVEPGKKRKINVWEMKLFPDILDFGS
jgi:N-acetylglutamate synthase-like GNAT family acetyltransferase